MDPPFQILWALRQPVGWFLRLGRATSKPAHLVQPLLWRPSPTARPGCPPGQTNSPWFKRPQSPPDEIAFLLSRLTTTLLQPSSREQFLIHSFFGSTIETGSLVSNLLSPRDKQSFLFLGLLASTEPFGLDRKSSSQLGLPGLLNRDQHSAILAWTNQINLHGKDPLASTHSTGPELVPHFHLQTIDFT